MLDLTSVAENQDIVFFKVRDPDGTVRLIPAKLLEKAILAGGVLVSADPTISRRPEAELRGATQTARSKLSHRFEEWDGPPGIGIVGGVRKPAERPSRIVDRTAEEEGCGYGIVGGVRKPKP